MISLYQSIRALECLCAISLLIQTLEFLRLQSATRADGIWAWAIQRNELAHSNIWLQKLAAFLYRDRTHRLHLIIRAVAASSLFFGASLVSCMLLFFSTLILLVRWRGAFNGGSDFMTLAVLMGLLISQLAAIWVHPVMAWKAGLWFITIQAISSYFVSGSVKLFDKHWRNGDALPFFINGAIFGPLKSTSLFYSRWFAISASWAFILWECSFPIALAGPVWAMIWCAIAALFHFLVFWHFGLNRFFWAWLTTFPAIIYCSTQL